MNSFTDDWSAAECDEATGRRVPQGDKTAGARWLREQARRAKAQLTQQDQGRRAYARAQELGHIIPFLNWVHEEGDRWTLCTRCSGLAEIREDGSFYGPALSDPCTGVTGGYAMGASMLALMRAQREGDP